MIFEIRGDEPKCDKCGAGPLVFRPSANRHLESELISAFGEQSSWRHPMRRKENERIRSEIHRVGKELREATKGA